jgi:hypothetical protein
MTEEAKKLVELEISKETELDLEIKDGKMRFSFGYDGKGLDGGVYLDLDPEYFMDKLAALIPGEIDDALLGMLKVALKAL